MIVMGDFPTYWRSNRQKIIDEANGNGLPTMYPNSVFVEEGGLASFGPDIRTLFEVLADYVDLALHTPPQQPPPPGWQSPDDALYSFVINGNTADQLGIDTTKAVEQYGATIVRPAASVGRRKPFRFPDDVQAS